MSLTVVAVVCVFGVLVLVHELGHFVTAKLTGMRVDEFAIGFGPKLVSFQRGETVYSIRCIPLGGFNNIAGMDSEDNPAGERGYCRKPIPARMLVILAGSAMNLILPVFLFFGIFFFSGVTTQSTEPVLGTVIPDRPAAMAGLREGDRILGIGDTPVEDWMGFVNIIKSNDGQPLTVYYERDGVKGSTVVTPLFDAENNRAMVGVMGVVETTHPGFFESMGLAVQRTGTIIYAMIQELVRLIAQLSGENLAGPMGVVHMTGEVAKMGLVPLLNFTAFLSLNLGIINLFPVPALDGGHFVTLLVEALRGKPLSSQAQRYTQTVGIALLLVLMVYATKNDIVRIFFGG